MPKNTKIIFPSTHLVFEDCKINKETFYESSRPLPKLAYARGKLDCENSGKDQTQLFNPKIRLSLWFWRKKECLTCQIYSF